MAVRDDITVLWHLSPRIITVAAPSTEVTIQDLHDTIRDIEDEPTNLIYPTIITTAGKESLGGGVLVGLTATLLDAQLAFEARTTEYNSGTATGGSGITLEDFGTGTDFVASGVLRGDIVENTADGSQASVTIVSTNQLSITNLTGGTVNQFGSGDSYTLWHVIQCDINGGNLVAVDSNGSEISSIFTTAFTQVVRTSASSATLQEAQDIVDLKFAVETLRPHHSGFGYTYYWDPENGNDDNDGASGSKAKKTFAATHDLVLAGNHDVIVCLSTIPGQTVVDTTIEITKNYTFVRGPGRDFKIKPTSIIAPTVRISAIGVEISGFVIETAAIGGQDCVAISSGADFALIEGIWIQSPSGDGISFDSATLYARINQTFIDDANTGIRMDGLVRHTRISNTEISNCSVGGVSLAGASARDNVIESTVSVINCDTGINIGVNVLRTLVRAGATVFGNITENITDNGTDTQIESIVNRATLVNAIWDETIAAHIIAGSFGEGTQLIKDWVQTLQALLSKI